MVYAFVEAISLHYLSTYSEIRQTNIHQSENDNKQIMPNNISLAPIQSNEGLCLR